MRLRLHSLLIGLALVLAACSGLGRGSPTASPPIGTGAASSVPATASVGTPSPDAPSPPTTMPGTGEPAALGLRLWLPPEFAPDVNSASGRLLADQISAFESAHPGVAVEVRLKSAAGQGGLLSSLVTASNVAPSILPNLIALRRDDLVTAAAAGLITPLEGQLPSDLLADYYPFAQALGRVNGVWLGLPFAADARIMAYLASAYPAPPLTWGDVVTGTLMLPGAEPTGLTVLNLYLALGGTLTDDSGSAHLDAEPLAQALEVFQALQTGGALSPAVLDLADPAASWQAFRERRATLAVTSAQWYLAENYRVDGAAATLLPTRGEAPLALADGWSWSLVNTSPAEQALCAALLAWLAAPAQNAAWSEAAQVLPTRAETLAGWQAQRLIPFVSDVLTHAQLQPAGAVLAQVGPPLRQALSDVLSGRATPFAAATLAAQSVGGS